MPYTFDPLMGVSGTTCMLCNIPVQHDHYVPSPSLGMYKIYRGPDQDFDDDEPVVRFGPEHAWLLDAVAVTENGIVSGPVQDSAMETAGDVLFVGWDDEPVFHRYCHDLLGGDLVTSMHAHQWAQIESYNGQLFEMREFIDHGKGWALRDPQTDARSRERIDAILAQARATSPRNGRATRVEDVLASDRGWCARTLRSHLDDGNTPAYYFVRYRGDIHPELDCASYPIFICAVKPYGEGMPDPATLDELERFEVLVKAAIERDRAAILLMTTIGDGQAQFLMQARDESATVAAISALPQGERTRPIEWEIESDPAWSVYFKDMHPR